MTGNETTYSAFFYGTLMASQVLHRVCHGSMNPDNPIFASHNLSIVDAILPDHKRHRVKNADYPAIIECPNSNVRGTYVTGLTTNDLWRLDIFEGDEYRRKAVKVHLIRQSDEVVEAETYIWIGGKHRLENDEWDFTEFKRDKMQFWVGLEGEREYSEVDEAVAAASMNDGTGGRGLNGHITHELQQRG